MSKKLVIFDLDGVLIDSRDNMKYAWEAVRSETKVSVEFEQYFELIGKPFLDILDVLHLSKEGKKIEQIFRTSSAKKMSQINFYPGVIDTLNELRHKGLKLSVVTSKDKLRTDAVLSRLPFIFDDVQTPSDFYRGKPAPDQLLLSMAITQVDPKDSVYIGDMDVDFHAANRAGVDYLHAEWGYGKKPSSNVGVIGTIEDLNHYLGLI
jgi:HAD superfamily hydrolase (TIGR01549 family)